MIFIICVTFFISYSLLELCPGFIINNNQEIGIATTNHGTFEFRSYEMPDNIQFI